MKARKFVSMLAAGAAVLSVSVGAMLPTAASAQIGGVVFDPRNYAQNILTAARTLEQINNQIRQLQNQATSLVNEARNLQSLPLTVLEPLQAQIRQTQALLGEAQRVAYDVRQIEREFQNNYRAGAMIRRASCGCRARPSVLLRPAALPLSAVR